MADLNNLLKQQYASALESELSNIKNAYKQNTLALDRVEEAIPEQYEAQRNQVAATNALEKQAFDERANAMGLNTGTSGQAQLARSSVYQRDLAGIGAAEASALADVALQKSQAQAEYEAAMARARAESDAALNNALYNELLRQQSYSAPVGLDGGVATDDKNGKYTLGEMIDATAAGASKAQIENALAKRGVDINNKYVQADIKWALSK